MKLNQNMIINEDNLGELLDMKYPIDSGLLYDGLYLSPDKLNGVSMCKTSNIDTCRINIIVENDRIVKICGIG